MRNYETAQDVKNSSDFPDPCIKISTYESRIDIDHSACYIVENQWHKREEYLAPLFETGGDHGSL
jgi:hypothetical protein